MEAAAGAILKEIFSRNPLALWKDEGIKEMNLRASADPFLAKQREEVGVMGEGKFSTRHTT